MFSRLFKNKATQKRASASLDLTDVSNPKRMANSSKKYQARDLRIGMYVAALDRPWAEVPFAAQGFYIRNEADINSIASCSEFAYVDDSAAINDAAAERYERTIYKLPDRGLWKQEREGYQRLVKLTFVLFDQISIADAGASVTAKEIVDACIESVLANAYAILLVAQIEGETTGVERHSLSCCALAAAFGRHLGVKGEDLYELALAALLHDVGMLEAGRESYGVTAALQSDDLMRLREHTTFGRSTLMCNEDFWSAVDVACAHHEWVDGNGYPRGLKGWSIPYNARIVSIIEAYDSMVSAHSYKAAISPTLAMTELYNSAGKQFDQRLVEAFIRFLGLYPLGSLVQLESGEVGVVVEKNPFYKVLPKIALFCDEKGGSIKPKVVDLYAESLIENGQMLRVRDTLPNESFGINILSLLEAGIAEFDEEAVLAV